MGTYKPIIAVVGSARAAITGNQEQAARLTCNALGVELAKAGWRVAVYSGEADFIEQDVVSGYLAAGPTGEDSIVCYYPQGEMVKFTEMDDPGKAVCFKEIQDPSGDWEVSFYHSILRVDAVLLLGGGVSTLIAGQLALGQDIPILALATFGGSARKIWQHLSAKSTLATNDDVQAMVNRTPDAAQAGMKALANQHEKRTVKQAAAQQELETIRKKAGRWDVHVKAEQEQATRTGVAFGFLVAFIALLIAGLVVNPAWAWVYPVIAVLGLCTAGGMGATVRMITPDAPAFKGWVAPIVGIVVGIVFTVLYLIPQHMDNTGFLLPGDGKIPNASRTQYITALVVAFMAGLGFDFALEQLLRRSKERGDAILQSSTSTPA